MDAIELNRPPQGENMLGKTPSDARSKISEPRRMSRQERFELARRRVRFVMAFSLGLAVAATLMVYGAFVMTTNWLL